MAVEVGNILEGKVTGITDFGAFVDLPDGKSGMVHISEVAPTYVNKIADHLTEGQIVKVKVLNIAENGKISLSIKKAMDNPNKNERSDRRDRKERDGERSRDNRDNRNSRGNKRFDNRNRQPAPPVTGPGNFEWQSSRKNENASFEDLMSKFKQTSEEKFSDLKRGTEVNVRRARRNQKP
ncbi:MAG: S1 RNA-binding domain-containing protein [Acutalibacteraceae bacterium]|nr:S1 RNA-binding domain-containing protein [Acutalibacteraceae bacterium]